MNLIDEKRTFIVASANPELIKHYEEVIKKHISNSQVFSCTNGQEVMFKVENVPPHVLIVDCNLPKISGLELTEKFLHNTKLPDFSIIIASDLPDKEHFVDEVVTGKVQFLVDIMHDAKFNLALTRALNRLSQSSEGEYKLVFSSPSVRLFNEGDEGSCAYIVRKGELKAYKKSGNGNVHIGDIHAGEFVGEMAHINGEPRSATVICETDCELIEIPFGTLDSVLFSKPAWSKALVMTLSKRLKSTSDAVIKD